MAQLPDYWVVRELTERDYGIDLMVEVFTPGLKDRKGKDAFAKTGAIFHVQIKGVDEPVTRIIALIYMAFCYRENALHSKFAVLWFFSGGFRMPNYRRNLVPGGCYFFTVNLLERRRTLLTDDNDILRDSIRRARCLYPFHIDAWVVLPDHIYALHLDFTS